MRKRRVVKRGAPCGEANYNHKLTVADVLDIRARGGRGEKQSVLGREYHVSGAVIRRILLRRTWKHVPEARPEVAVA